MNPITYSIAASPISRICSGRVERVRTHAWLRSVASIASSSRFDESATSSTAT